MRPRPAWSENLLINPTAWAQQQGWLVAVAKRVDAFLDASPPQDRGVGRTATDAQLRSLWELDRLVSAAPPPWRRYRDDLLSDIDRAVALYEAAEPVGDVRRAALSTARDVVPLRASWAARASCIGGLLIVTAAVLNLRGVWDGPTWQQWVALTALLVVGVLLLAVGLTAFTTPGVDLRDLAIGTGGILLTALGTVFAYAQDAAGWLVVGLCVSGVLLGLWLLGRASSWGAEPEAYRPGDFARRFEMLNSSGPSAGTEARALHLILDLGTEIDATARTAGSKSARWTFAYVTLALLAPLGSAAAVVTSQTGQNEPVLWSVTLTTMLASIGAVSAAALATLNPAQRANEQRTVQVACQQLVREIARFVRLDYERGMPTGASKRLVQLTRRYEDLLDAPGSATGRATSPPTTGP